MAVQDLERAAAKDKEASGLGLDALRPSDIGQLPVLAKQELANILTEAEEAWA